MDNNILDTKFGQGTESLVQRNVVLILLEYASIAANIIVLGSCARVAFVQAMLGDFMILILAPAVLLCCCLPISLVLTWQDRLQKQLEPSHQAPQKLPNILIQGITVLSFVWMGLAWHFWNNSPDFYFLQVVAGPLHTIFSFVFLILGPGQLLLIQLIQYYRKKYAL